MAKNEIDRIVDQMERAFDGDAWHGPSVMDILRDLNANQAAARLFPDTHTVRELVAHLTAWKGIMPRRMRGEVVHPTVAEDWPAPRGTWKDAVAELQGAHRTFVKAVRAMPPAKLRATVPGKNHDFYVALHGMVQHDLYHAGQIALLKKALQ